MKKILLTLCVISSALLTAQIRYHNEVFSQVKITKDVTYGTNIDFLKNSNFQNTAQLGADVTDLKTRVATNQTIPAKYYDPADTTTVVKVSDIKMDIYEPMADTISNRPLVIYIHTGNFLPPGLNGSPNGIKTDSSAIVACTKLAKRGFVAISVDYRLGWNPIASGPSGPIIRRATLLNAVYRAIHDVKQNVRTLKADAAMANTYGIDTNQIVLYGEGSGGYVALAYATLDKQSETAIPKFLNPQTMQSYIDASTVGDVDGFNGLLNLYVDNGHTSDISFVVNTGGALADTSWMEAGDAPMVSFHCVRDPFAPFGEGTVIVPTTNEDVVDVQGPNVFIPKANAFGNNASYQGFTYNDPYTMVARSRYGKTYQYRATLQTNITVDANAEGLFPVLRPYKANLFENEGAPWQWWDPQSAFAQTVVAAGPPAVTAHMASLQSNPTMSPTKGRTYTDTVLNYAVPRIMVGLKLDGYLQIGLEEVTISDKVIMYPNPVVENLYFTLKDADIKISSITITDLTSKVVKTLNITRDQNSINLSDLKSGVYMIELNSNKGTAVKKIIKQ